MKLPTEAAIGAKTMVEIQTRMGAAIKEAKDRGVTLHQVMQERKARRLRDNPTIQQSPLTTGRQAR